MWNILLRNHFFKCDLKRVFHGTGFYLAFLISIVALLRPLHGAFVEKMDGTFFQFLSVPLAGSDFTPFAALFCVIPYAWSFCDDYNTGYIKNIISRIGIKKYSLQRPFVVYQILWFLLDRNAFNPVYQLRGDSDYLPSLWFVLGYQLFLVIICIMISCIGIRKKVGE